MPLRLTLIAALLGLTPLGCDEAVMDVDASEEIDAGRRDAGRPDARSSRPDAPRFRRDAGTCDEAIINGPMRAFELSAGGFELGSMSAAADGGVAISGALTGSGVPIVLRLERTGERRWLRRAAGVAVSSVRSATDNDDHIAVAYRTEAGIVIAALDPAGEPLFANVFAGEVSGATFVESPLVAADATLGVFVTSAVTRGAAEGTWIARFAWTGELQWQREIFGANATTVPMALAAVDDGALVLMQSDSFAEHTFVDAFGETQRALGPWAVRFDEAGEVRFEAQIDALENDRPYLNVAYFRAGVWLLGGATEPAFGAPWVVELRDDGILRSSTVLQGEPNHRMLGFQSSPDLRLVQAGPVILRITRASGAVTERLRLDAQGGAVAAAPNGLWFAGPIPACSRSRALFIQEEVFCGSTRRDLGVIFFPLGNAPPCLRDLELTASDAQTLEHPPTLLRSPVSTLTDPALPFAPLDLTWSYDTPGEIELCMSGPACSFAR